MDVEDGAGWRVVPANCSRDGMGRDRMNRIHRMVAIGRGAAHGGMFGSVSSCVAVKRVHGSTLDRVARRAASSMDPVDWFGGKPRLQEMGAWARWPRGGVSSGKVAVAQGSQSGVALRLPPQSIGQAEARRRGLRIELAEASR